MLETKSSVLVVYDVKLYHPYSIVICGNAGKSVRFLVSVPPNTQLRSLIESGTNGFFRGDICIQCSELAKVSYELK